MAKSTVRSFGAVLAGFLLIVALSVGTDTICESTGIFPTFKEQYEHNVFPLSMLLLATAYRIVFSIAGCYLAARLAPSRPMFHAVMLGVLGIVVSTLGLVVMWGHGPAWYPITLILVSLPCAWVGGRIRTAHAVPPTGE